MRRVKAAAAALLVAGWASCAGGAGDVPRPAAFDAAGRPPVALIVIDGLDARDLDAESMPELARAWHEARWCHDAHGHAAMPARTNVNHATLTTGVEPEAHGIVGNAFWARGDAPPRKLGAAPDFLSETVFTLAGARTPPLRTALAVGKPKLDLMFAAPAPGQRPPTAVWSPRDAAAADRDPRTGYAFDRATLAGAQSLLAGTPGFLLVNLADVDRISHGAGPHADAARKARRATDRALAAFVRDLLDRPEWRDGTIVVTADHGFDTVAHPAVDFAARLRAAGLEPALVAVADGGVAHVYARDPRAADTGATLAAARRLALGTDGVAEALYLARNPVDGDDVHTLARAHPEWHLANERSGDLLLVAAPGYVLAEAGGDEAPLAGNHGGPAELDVPVVVLGAGAYGDGPWCADVHAADLGATVLHCLGLRDVARLDGGATPEGTRGRDLPGLCDPTAKARAPS